MRRGVLLLIGAALLAGPASGLAQDASDPSSAESGRREAGMTALIRQALQDPNAPKSWAGLAQGLSDFQGDRSRGAPDVSAAIRIADSLAFSPLPAASAADRAAARGWAAGIATRASEVLPRIGPFLPYSAAAFVLMALLVNGWIPGRRARSRGMGTARTPTRPAPGRNRAGTSRNGSMGRGRERDSRSRALSMVEHGIPANEIARRTGLAQDEVAVVLALHRQRQQDRASGHPLPRSA